MGKQDAQCYSQIPGHLPHFCFPGVIPCMCQAQNITEPSLGPLKTPLTHKKQHYQQILHLMGSQTEQQSPNAAGQCCMEVCAQGQVSSWAQTPGQCEQLWHGSLLENGAGDPWCHTGHVAFRWDARPGRASQPRHQHTRSSAQHSSRVATSRANPKIPHMFLVLWSSF